MARPVHGVSACSLLLLLLSTRALGNYYIPPTSRMDSLEGELSSIEFQGCFIPPVSARQGQSTTLFYAAATTKLRRLTQGKTLSGPSTADLGRLALASGFPSAPSTAVVLPCFRATIRTRYHKDNRWQRLNKNQLPFQENVKDPEDASLVTIVRCRTGTVCSARCWCWKATPEVRLPYSGLAHTLAPRWMARTSRIHTVGVGSMLA
ncbi:hypothetical protein GE09DRAFT_710667 [Coniochaeta sp. 2T2.1]|nr:hypothetical protein GE09DRAFT_710667 [Coniochaeta sp. 2T2.1]